MTEYLPVPEERAGLELDEFLCLLYPGVTKGFLRNQVRDGHVLINGQPTQPGHRLRRSELICLDIEEESAPRRPIGSSKELSILLETEHVLVVDKPPDLAVEPERWDRDTPCLAGQLLSLAEERAVTPDKLEWRPRLVHRIDKDTTGCVLVAKEIETERMLREAFDSGGIHKHYVALVEGEHPLLDGEVETIDLALGPDPRKTGRMQASHKGKESQTEVRVLERFRGYTLVECSPLTGRTHQIRVHMASLGFPLAVDRQYGRRDELKLSELKTNYRPKPGAVERPLIDRLTLHAARLSWPDPSGEGRQQAQAPLPKDFERTLKQLRKVRAPRQ